MSSLTGSVKEIASKLGVYATFMPKPIFGENGSGMHTHQSLFKGSKNAFFDAKAKYNLSDIAHSYIAGLLKHAGEICSIFAQTTNSYKRLVPGFEAPVNLAYSSRNRSAAVRIPMYSESPKAKRIEFRTPDPSCNGYLAFSAMLMAVIDGIENKIDPGDPLDKNIYDLPPEELAEVESAPGSLEEALNALRDDHEFLLKGDVFTKDAIDMWLEYKTENEVNEVRLRPHPHEFFLYFDI
jgi:glutamine synthetase